MEKPTRGPIGYSRISQEQELVTYDDIKSLLDMYLEIKAVPIPDLMIGSLWTISGKVEVAEAIMGRLEYRSKLFGGHTKPQHEENKEDENLP